MRERDRHRREQAAQMIAASALSAPEDFFHAARIFNTGILLKKSNFLHRRTEVTMTDMLVRLYKLPEITPHLNALHQKGLEIRRPYPSERYVLADWVRQHFEDSSWAIGCEVALGNKPVSCHVAVIKNQAHVPGDNPYDLPDEVLVGFACYDVASKGMFGAMGVKEEYRRQGIGTALLLASLHAMKEEGYAYAVIGWVSSVEFYAHAAGATVIPDSEPGIFRGKLIA
jgi:GNAT superfamily N-acetyltransferase